MTVNFEYLPATMFSLFIIFSRMGPLVMMMPGIGEYSVPMRSRLAFAVMLTVCVYPAVLPKLPVMPNTLVGLMGLSFKEALIGFAFGTLIKMLSSGLQVAGNIISFQSGLSFAQTADPQSGRSDSVFSSFMLMMATTMILVLDLHHLVITAMVETYMLFPPASPINIGAFGEAGLDIVANSFRIGVQLATPFIVFGLIFFLGLGILSRLIPQIQVFFMAMPANIFIGILLFALLLGAMMNGYMAYYENSIVNLMR